MNSQEPKDHFDKPWIEKYRPLVLNDVVGNPEIVEQLRQVAKYGNMPHLILVGPPGTGKTTSVMALAHELLGDNFKKATLEMNASDDRGIDMVRDKIKSFANIKLNLPEKRHKIIILDEADSMTATAQQALRIIISDYSNTTRFALACNDSTKLIEPIQSRCTLLRFSKLTKEQIKERLLTIIKNENIPYDEGGLKAIVDTSDGDMRYALNNLQSTFAGYGFLNHENVYKIVDIPRPEILLNIIKTMEAEKLQDALNAAENLVDEGYTVIDIVSNIGRIIQENERFHEKQKLNLLKILTEFKIRMLEGINSKIQLYGFISSLYEEINKTKKMEVDS